MIETDSAREIRDKVRRGELTPSELLKFRLQQIKKHNGKVNALRYVHTKEAKAAAVARDKLYSGSTVLPRLHGLTFSVKDHIDVAGLPRSDGSNYGASSASAKSCHAVHLLEEAGAYCIGKGNQAHHGRSFFTSNSDFGTTENPFKDGHSPGGSGGGDAVALSLGMCDFALGTDSGGSVRIPANFCGVFGLLPTAGLMSEAGLANEPHTHHRLFRRLGIFTKSVDDLELIFRVVARFDPNCPTSMSSPFRSTLLSKPTRQFRWFPSLNGIECSAEIRSSLEKIVDRLEQIGYTAVEEIPPLFEQCIEPYIIAGVQAGLVIDDLVNTAAGFPPNKKEESEDLRDVRARIQAELPPLSAETLLKAWYAVDRLRNQTAQLFDGFDFILSPVSALSAPPQHPRRIEVDGVPRKTEEVIQFASVANVLSLPALAFPTQLSSTGLPLGLQLIGPRFHEERLFGILREVGYTKYLCTSGPTQRPL